MMSGSYESPRDGGSKALSSGVLRPVPALGGATGAAAPGAVSERGAISAFRGRQDSRSGRFFFLVVTLGLKAIWGRSKSVFAPGAIYARAGPVYDHV